jgi:molybdate transport system substrate-binding protein
MRKATIRIGMTALLIALAFAFAGCGSSDSGEAEDQQSAEKTEVKVFAAASMQSSLEELEKSFEADNQDIDILLNCDSSGTLQTQIMEGAPCDIFFSAAQKQMDELEGEGLVDKESRQNVLNNQLVVITQPDSKTAVTGLENIGDAGSIALADGSVPVGKYTRQAMIKLELLDEVEDPSTITTQQVSEALGGVEISEQGNVSKVLTAVEEGSCEVGTVYLSDTYGHEDAVKIIEKVPYDVTGDIIYPIALINNPDADDAEKEAAAKVLEYFTGEDAKALYDKHLFDTNVE